MAHLTYLPPELHCAIASLLRPRDIVKLRASCKKLRVLLTEHENYIVHAIITYRYSFLAMKVPLPQECSSIDPEVHEAMKINTSTYWTRSRRLSLPYPVLKLEYPQHFCQCASCVYAWQLIWEKAYEALWYWVVGPRKRPRRYVLQHLLFVYFYLNADDLSERQADFIVPRMQAFVVEITKSKLAYAYLLDHLLESLAGYIEYESVRALEKAPVFPPVGALCHPTKCHIDPEFDCWIREHVDQDNSDRAAREHKRDVPRGHTGFLNWISREFAFLSDKIGIGKSPYADLGHSILQYLAEMKVMIDRGEDTIAHEASVQAQFGAEAARHNVVVVWARSERHLQVIQLRKEKMSCCVSGCIALSVTDGQSAWFPIIFSKHVPASMD